MLRQAVRTALAHTGDRTPSPDAWGLVLVAAGVEPTKAAGLPARLGCVFHLGRWREQDVVVQLQAWGDALRVRAEPEVAAVVDRAAAALAAEISGRPRCPTPSLLAAPPSPVPTPPVPPHTRRRPSTRRRRPRVRRPPSCRRTGSPARRRRPRRQGAPAAAAPPARGASGRSSAAPASAVPAAAPPGGAAGAAAAAVAAAPEAAGQGPAVEPVGGVRGHRGPRAHLRVRGARHGRRPVRRQRLTRLCSSHRPRCSPYPHAAGRCVWAG